MIAAEMIDAETLFDTLFRRDLPDVESASEYDQALVSSFPAIRWSIGGLGQVLNGPGGYDVTLTWNVLGEPSAAWDAMSRAYAAVHSWPVNSVIDGVGWVSQVTDSGVPSKTPLPDVDNKSITQYAAAVALVLRK